MSDLKAHLIRLGYRYPDLRDSLRSILASLEDTYKDIEDVFHEKMRRLLDEGVVFLQDQSIEVFGTPSYEMEEGYVVLTFTLDDFPNSQETEAFFGGTVLTERNGKQKVLRVKYPT
jgi:hypothetical protein